MIKNITISKKYVLFLITFMLCVFCSFVPAYSTSTSGNSINFDGTQSEWAETELQEAYSNGLTYGQIEQNYQKPITREEFCVIVVKLYEKLGGTAPIVGSNPFTDTSNPEILKAYSLGIVKGTSTTTFSPANNITRQEICVMILRALSACRSGLDTSLGSTFPFEDSASIASWALDSMKFAYKNEIMKGTGPATISPLYNTNREQAIILLKRTYNKFSQDSDNLVVDSDFYSILAKKEFTRDPGFTKNKVPVYIPQNDIGETADIELNYDLAKFPLFKITPLPEIEKLPEIGQLPKINEDTSEGSVSSNTSSVGFPLTSNDFNLAGVQYLGRSYNAITGLYADDGPDSLSEYYILDIGKLLRDGRIYKLDTSSSTSHFISGTSAKSYSETMATSVGISGGYMCFTGSVKTNFSSQSMTETNRKFGTLLYESPQYSLYIDDMGIDYRDYLNPQFKKVLDDPNVNPDEIYKIYGTHLLRSVRMGGRIEYNATTNSTYNQQSSSFEADVKASFNAGFASAGVQVSHSQSQASQVFNENSEITIKAYPAYGSHNLNPKDFTKWFESLETKPGISDFGSNPLIPLYELAPDPIRKLALSISYNKYVENNQYIPASTVMCITGIRLDTHTLAEAANIPNEYIDPETNEKWKLISNTAAHVMLPGDKLRYLYVREGLSDNPKNPPIVAVFLVNETQGENAKTIFREYWKDDSTARLWGDGAELQSGSGLNQYISEYVGDRIKLYYVTSQNQRPVTQLRVRHVGWDGSNNYYPAVTGHDTSFIPVQDLGSHMNGEHKIQDCDEGAPEYIGLLPVSRFHFLEYSYD